MASAQLPTPEELERARKRINKTVAKLDKDLGLVDRTLAEYDELDQALVDLPQKLSHPILVPFSGGGLAVDLDTANDPLAFFPGRLVHTNEVTHIAGDRYFLRRTAPN